MFLSFKKHCRKLLLGVLALTSQMALAGEYMPWQLNDYAHYRDDLSGSVVEGRVDKSLLIWSHVTQLAGLGGQWIMSTAGNERLHLFDESTKALTLLMDFNAAVGYSRKVSVQPCNVGTATLAERGLHLDLPAGSFHDVIRLDFTTSCADGGVQSAWFARGVGPVQWTENSIAGPRTFQMTGGTIGGMSYPKLSGLSTTGSFPAPSKWINMMPGPDVRLAAPAADVALRIANHTDQTVHFTFPSSQRYEIELTDTKGNVVLRWSDGKPFLTVLGAVVLAPGESVAYSDRLVLVLKDGSIVPQGDYTLSVYLAGAVTDDSGVRLNVAPPRVSSPLSIRYAY